MGAALRDLGRVRDALEYHQRALAMQRHMLLRLAAAGGTVADAFLPTRDVALSVLRLELAVLSACETGVGSAVRRGEGAMGLQHAFLLAGTRDVVSSLWSVEDEATAALMGLFYRFLWKEGLPPLEALHQAQLYLLRHPEVVPLLAKRRGDAFLVDDLPPVKAPAPGARRASPYLWAGFTLSGLGRC